MINTELHNGDCLEYMKKIPTSSIDLIITDPPYNLGKFMEERDTNLVKMRDNFFGAAGWDDLDYKEWKKSMNKFFHQASRVLKDGGSIIVFMAIIKVETIIQLAQKHGLYYKTSLYPEGARFDRGRVVGCRDSRAAGPYRLLGFEVCDDGLFGDDPYRESQEGRARDDRLSGLYGFERALFGTYGRRLAAGRDAPRGGQDDDGRRGGPYHRPCGRAAQALVPDGISGTCHAFRQEILAVAARQALLLVYVQGARFAFQVAHCPLRPAVIVRLQPAAVAAGHCFCSG